MQLAVTAKGSSRVVGMLAEKQHIAAVIASLMLGYQLAIKTVKFLTQSLDFVFYTGQVQAPIIPGVAPVNIPQICVCSRV